MQMQKDWDFPQPFLTISPPFKFNGRKCSSVCVTIFLLHLTFLLPWLLLLWEYWWQMRENNKYWHHNLFQCWSISNIAAKSLYLHFLFHKQNLKSWEMGRSDRFNLSKLPTFCDLNSNQNNFDSVYTERNKIHHQQIKSHGRWKWHRIRLEVCSYGDWQVGTQHIYSLFLDKWSCIEWSGCGSILMSAPPLQPSKLIYSQSMTIYLPTTTIFLHTAKYYWFSMEHGTFSLYPLSLLVTHPALKFTQSSKSLDKLLHRYTESNWSPSLLETLHFTLSGFVW